MKKNVGADWIVVVSDMQVGHYRAIRPTHVDLVEGDAPPLGTGQRYLLACWEHFTKRVTSLPGSYVLVLNGDLIQGHRKVWATELCFSDMLDQVNACGDLLDAIAKQADRVFEVEGTPYHDAEYSRHERAIARRFNAVAAEEMNLRFEKAKGKVVNFCHGGSTAFVYRSSLMEREMFFSALAAEMKQYPRVDVLVRSHTHFALEVRYPGHKKAIITPCWQLPTRYIAKSSIFRLQPVFGSFILGPERDLAGGLNGEVHAYADCIYPGPIDLHRVHSV